MSDDNVKELPDRDRGDGLTVRQRRVLEVIRSGVAGTSGTAVPVGRETSCGRAGRTGTRTGAGATSHATAALIWSSIGAVSRGLVVASIERMCEELPG